MLFEELRNNRHQLVEDRLEDAGVDPNADDEHMMLAALAAYDRLDRLGQRVPFAAYGNPAAVRRPLHERPPQFRSLRNLLDAERNLLIPQQQQPPQAEQALLAQAIAAQREQIQRRDNIMNQHGDMAAGLRFARDARQPGAQ